MLGMGSSEIRSLVEHQLRMGLVSHDEAARKLREWCLREDRGPLSKIVVRLDVETVSAGPRGVSCELADGDYLYRYAGSVPDFICQCDLNKSEEIIAWMLEDSQ